MSHSIREMTVAELSRTFRGVDSGILVDYQGLSALEVSKFRAALRGGNINCLVVKNSLAVRALEANGVAGMGPLVIGPTCIVWGGEDASIAARALAEWNRKNKAVKIRGGFLGGGLLSMKEVDFLSKLPDKSTLRAQIAGLVVMQLQNIATLVNNMIAQVGWAVDALKEKRETEEKAAPAGETAPPPPAPTA
jgi:large subunit ribosomal protein L10